MERSLTESLHNAERGNTVGTVELILSAINRNPRTILLLILRKEDWTSLKDLYGKFRNLVQGTGLDEVTKTTIKDYCSSLEKLGLAEGSEDDYYRLTHQGVEYAQPAAALAMLFESSNGISLYQFLGGSSRNSRARHAAPYYRSLILLNLALTNRTLSRKEIALRCDIPPAVTGVALRALTKNGLVNYESVKPHTQETTITYSLSPTPPPEVGPNGKSKSLTELITMICRSLAVEEKIISPRSVYDRVPSAMRKTWKQRNLKHQVADIMSTLDKQGFLIRGKYKSQVKLSEAGISNLGVRFVQEVLIPIVNIVQDRSSRVEHETINSVRANIAQLVPISAEAYYPHSQLYKQKVSSVIPHRLKSAMFRNPYGISANQASELVSLNSLTTRRLLNDMAESGEVQRRKVNGVFYYFSN